MNVVFICPECEYDLRKSPFSWLWVCDRCDKVWKTNEVLVKWE